MDTGIINRELFDQSVDHLDNLYVVTQAPQTVESRVSIDIDLDEDAAVIDRHRDQYPAQTYTVSEIRAGRSEGWLLSGGMIIFDHEGRIAVGMRDGNAADPFAYTNIAAGRCDRKFKEHCREELASEFVLCVQKPDGHWEQINFGKGTIPLANVRKGIPSVAKWKDYVSIPRLTSKIFVPPTRSKLPEMTTLSIYWQEKSARVWEEHLQGILLIDRDNHSVEFRLPVEIDLSEFRSSEIFFAEGTGFATWMFPKQIQEIGKQIRFDGARTVTPFLAWITNKLI